MNLTLNEKFDISKTFWTNGFIKSLQDRLDYFNRNVKADEVLCEIFMNSYSLMEEIKTDVGTECDPFYPEFPFLMYGYGQSMYSQDQLFFLKQKMANIQSDGAILYLPNEEFKKFISGEEEELKKGELFRRQCIIENTTVNSAYCKDSNSIWLDQGLIDNAILGVLVSKSFPDEYSPGKNGRWDEFFEGISHEFGHYLYKKEFESISAIYFVNHQQSKAHKLGTKYADRKSNDKEYVNHFFSLLVR